MNIIADGQERYVASNGSKIRKARRAVIAEVSKKYKGALQDASFLQRHYLRCKRWLELRRKLNELEQDLARNLYLNSSGL